MLGEDLDIGFYVEDAYAAYVTDLATSLHLIPHCRNARGAALEVAFTGPFLDLSEFREAVKEGKLVPYSELPWSVAEERGVQGAAGTNRSVTLHGWIEKLNAARKVQLMEPLIPAAELGATIEATSAVNNSGDPAQCAFALTLPPFVVESEGTANENRTLPRIKPSRFRIVGNLDFLLHLSSQGFVTDKSSATVDSPSKDECVQANSNFADDLDEATRAAHACRDALEQRDDISLARNAVNTVIKIVQMAEEHPGEVGSVFVDAKERVEYIQFSA
ncbi:hypothetical protein, conserved [Leishmania tarentolae]|uniref:Uncharacterized protein n=1 Tax=Leishmania tarentolae TaxID=5689 RepID=A0A640KV13_LEITA|nr:hypothetical protein, conserved [Leishmania tarentolae]